MTEKEFDKFFSSLAEMMKGQIEAQNEYSLEYFVLCKSMS